MQFLVFALFLSIGASSDITLDMFSPTTNTLIPPVPKLEIKGQKLCQIERVPDIMEVKKVLEDKGWVLIPGMSMRSLLLQFGATMEDMNELESGEIHRELPQDQQARKFFRKIYCHKMIMNTTNSEVFNANAHCLTQIPKEEIATSSDTGSRFYTYASDRYSRNTVSTAMARYVIKNTRPKQLSMVMFVYTS